MISLPLVLDVLISLTLIYLFLSLLASELQELMATFFEWRAVHLRQSIESILRDGDLAEADPDNVAIRKSVHLTRLLYRHPRIRALNQEAKGFAGFLRQFTFNRFKVQLLRLTQGLLQKLGQFSLRLPWRVQDLLQDPVVQGGPSYIQSHTLSSSILDLLKIRELARKVVRKRLEQNLDQVLSELSNARVHNLYDLARYSPRLKQEIDRLLDSFEQGQITIANTIEALFENLSIHTDQAETAESSNLSGRIRRSPYQKIFAIASSINLQDLFEALEILSRGRSADPSTLNPNVQNLVVELQAILSDDAELIQFMQTSVPPQLLKTFQNLVGDVQQDIQDLNQTLEALKHQTATWIDQVMDRAGGVYKRNATLVSFCLGLSLAISINADSLHMVQQLLTNGAARRNIVEFAQALPSLEESPSANSNLSRQLSSSVEDRLRELDTTVTGLPLGWDVSNLCNQNLSDQVNRSGENWLGSAICPSSSGTEVLSANPDALLGQINLNKFLRARWLGWLLTGLAISMGAGFWYDVLGRFIKIKNVGRQPNREDTAER